MRRATTLAAALLLPAVLAGCAPDSDPAADSIGRVEAMTETHDEDTIALGPEVDGAPTIEFFAPVETEFEVTGATTVPAGDVNITLTSEGNHNLALAGPGVPVALLWGKLAGAPEDGLTHSVKLLPGTYTYYCAVPGHRNAGMVGTITVTDGAVPSGVPVGKPPAPASASPSAA